MRSTSQNVRNLAVLLSLCSCFLGCPPGIELDFGPSELALLQKFQDRLDDGVEEFKIRGKDGIDTLDGLPAAFGHEGAELIEFQLTEWGSTMIGKGKSAIDCSAETFNRRCIANLDNLKESLKKAVKKVNEIDQESLNYDEKRSKWLTFLQNLEFEYVYLDPYICYIDHERIDLQYTKPDLTEFELKYPSTGVFAFRGTGLQTPRTTKDAGEQPPMIKASIVWLDMETLDSDGRPLELGRSDVTSALRYTTDSVMTLDLNSVKKKFQYDKDPFATTIVEFSNPLSDDRFINQIPVRWLDPTPSGIAPPKPMVTNLILGGRTEGENKDANRGFMIYVGAEGKDDVHLVASTAYMRDPLEYDDVDFPAVEMTVQRTFSVPTTGRFHAKADADHDCYASFHLTYTIQRYKWDGYNRTDKTFVSAPDDTVTRKIEIPMHSYEGNSFVHDFNWEGP